MIRYGYYPKFPRRGAKKKSLATIAIILSLVLFGSASILQAGSAEPEPSVPVETETATQPPEEPATKEEEENGLIDAAHERVSEAILTSAGWIDSFFFDERATREKTETRLRLGISNFSQEGELFRTDLRTSFRLDLPIFDERFHLLLAGDEIDRDPLGTERTARAPVLTPRERSGSVSLRYSFISELLRNASISTGLRFRSGSPVILLEPRYRQTFPLNGWDLRFTQRLTTYTDDSLEIRTIFDLERPLNNRFFFRSTADGAWFHDEVGYHYGFHANLFKPMDRDRMVQFLWSNTFVTRPTHALEEIVFLVSYRQRFWREWLFFEVSPQISLPREEDYEITPGITLRLDIIFGDFRSFGITDM
jgi:hypothetical protein